MYKLTWEGAQSTRKKVQACKQMPLVLGAAALAGAQVVANDAKRRAPVKTGNLRRSIHARVILATADVARAVTGPNALYGKWVEFGTGPHVIKPTHKKALYWKGALHPVKRVNHPGTTARPFLSPALKENLDMIIARMQTVFRAALKAVTP